MVTPGRLYQSGGERFNVIKPGICDEQQFERFYEKGTLESRHISCRLLRLPVPAPETPEPTEAPEPTEVDVRRFEEISRLLLLPGGIFRTTYRGRFADLDAVTLARMPAAFAPSEALTIYDWGASTALTSAEWATPLLRSYPHLRFVASDINLHLIEAAQSSGGGAFIFDQGGALIQYLRGPFVIPYLWKDSPRYPVNRLLRWYGESQARNIPLARLPAAWLQQTGSADVTLAGWTFRQISLLHPAAQALAARDPRFQVIRHSIFDAAAEPGHLVRTMNILNHQYFSPERLLAGIAAVYSSLREGGWWIVGRTTGTTDEGPQRKNNATILRKTGDRFVILERLGDGSEVEELGLSFRRS